MVGMATRADVSSPRVGSGATAGYTRAVRVGAGEVVAPSAFDTISIRLTVTWPLPPVARTSPSRTVAWMPGRGLPGRKPLPAALMPSYVAYGTPRPVAGVPGRPGGLRRRLSGSGDGNGHLTYDITASEGGTKLRRWATLVPRRLLQWSGTVDPGAARAEGPYGQLSSRARTHQRCCSPAPESASPRCGRSWKAWSMRPGRRSSCSVTPAEPLFSRELDVFAA
jgi:hypothetical protein